MSSSTEEATINPDGTFAGTTGGEAGPGTSGDSADSADYGDVPPGGAAEENVVKGTDPALFLAFGFIVVVVLYVLHYKRSKRKQEEMESFFLDMDGDKVRLCFHMSFWLSRLSRQGRNSTMNQHSLNFLKNAIPS